jgi:hypothetical protein
MAAIADFLSYNVYDIDISKVLNDFDLNFDLLQTTSKSIIVVKDFDQFLTKKSTAVSLYVMFVSIFFFCNFLAFKTLSNSYLELNDHKFFSQVDDIFQSGASLSPTRWWLRTGARPPELYIKLVITACKQMVTRGVLKRLGHEWKITPPQRWHRPPLGWLAGHSQTPIFFKNNSNNNNNK